MEVVSSTVCAKLTDKEICNILSALHKEFTARAAVVYLGSQALDMVQGQTGDVAKSNAQLISRADFVSNVDQFRVLIRKGLGQAGTHWQHIAGDSSGRKIHPYFDEIYICANEGNRPDIITLQKCDLIISKHVRKHLPNSSSEDASDAVSILQNEMQLLAAQYRDMMDGLDQRRKKIEDDNQEASVRRADEHANQLAEIEAHRNTELERISAAQAELDAAKKDLHDKHHMHERRELRQKINEEVKGRLKESIVSPSSMRLRYFVTMTAFYLSTFLGIFAYYSLHEFSEKISLPAEIIPSKQANGSVSIGYMGETRPADAFLWALMVRGMLASLGCVGFAVYAMSWMRNLYLSDVAVQREWEHFSADINRASWAIETIMEMNSQQKANAPEAWIQGVCSNLFQSNEKQNSHISNSNALETILGASIKGKLGTNGAEFEFDKKGTNKLAEALE